MPHRQFSKGARPIPDGIGRRFDELSTKCDVEKPQLLSLTRFQRSGPPIYTDEPGKARIFVPLLSEFTEAELDWMIASVLARQKLGRFKSRRSTLWESLLMLALMIFGVAMILIASMVALLSGVVVYGSFAFIWIWRTIREWRATEAFVRSQVDEWLGENHAGASAQAKVTAYWTNRL